MRYAKRIITFFLPIVALVSLARCAHDRTPVATTDAERNIVREAQMEPVEQETIPASPEVQETVAPSPDSATGEALSDGKILEVAHVANVAEITQAQLAEHRAIDSRVRAYAEEMVRMHKDADRRGDTLAQTIGIQPASSATSDKLQATAQAKFVQISEKQGAALDLAYVSAQIEEHGAVLKLLDDKLIPAATNENVKVLVTQVRPMVARHLEQAISLQSQLKEK